MSGSPDVFVNRRPALRVSDRGIHAACCGGNSWEARAGSATVFINGKPAHRMGDATLHCGGMGQLVDGSSDVIVGDGSAAGAGGGGIAAPVPGALELPKVAAPGVPFTIKMGPPKMPPFVDALIAPVSWSIDGEELLERGVEVVVTLGAEKLGRDVVIEARLGGAPAVAAVVRVPKLSVEGPDTLEVGEQIELRASVAPAVAGRYQWFDSTGAAIGEGPAVKLIGRIKSKQEGDQPVDCRFVADEGGGERTAQHPLTVEQVPRIKLPINVHIKGVAATVAWLGDNPMEVKIDGAVVASHALVDKEGRVVVSFCIAEGDHEVMVTSGGAHFAVGQLAIRIVHFSRKVTVTAKD